MEILDGDKLSGSLVLRADGKRLQKRKDRNIRRAIGNLKPMKGTLHFLQKFLPFKQERLMLMNDTGNIIGLTHSSKIVVQKSTAANNMPVCVEIDRANNSDELVEARDHGIEPHDNETKEFSLDSQTAKTCESIQAILQENGYTLDEFLALLQPDRILGENEIKQVNAIREQIGFPPKDTIMAKVIPQSDLYNYLYDENYNGIRGFTAVKEHSEKLMTLADNYEGARLDYNNTAFKVTNGIDGISQSDGSPDQFYGTIEYKLEEPGQLSIPRSNPYPGSYPYTGTGFTASKEIVLPEYYQEPRRFMNGDVLYIKDSKTGKAVFGFIYDEEVECWVKMD